MNLTEDDIMALVWASHAVEKASPTSADYDENHISILIAMSFTRHRMLEYRVQDSIQPKDIVSIDRDANSVLSPETSAEKSWGIRSVTHQYFQVELDPNCKQYVWIGKDGEINLIDDGI